MLVIPMVTLFQDGCIVKNEQLEEDCGKPLDLVMFGAMITNLEQQTGFYPPKTEELMSHVFCLNQQELR